MDNIVVFEASQPQNEINSSPDFPVDVRNSQSGEDVLQYILNIRPTVEYSLRTGCVMNRIMKVQPRLILIFFLYQFTFYILYY